MYKGKVVIVPNEEEILSDKFEMNIPFGLFHTVAYQDFSDKFNLGLKFSDDESQLAALTVAGLGHFNYKTEDDIGFLIFYIPEIVTDRQLEYFQTHKYDYDTYGQIGAYILRKMDDTIFTDEVYGINNIEREMLKRNKLLKEKNNHVR